VINIIIRTVKTGIILYEIKTLYVQCIKIKKKQKCVGSINNKSLYGKTY